MYTSSKDTSSKDTSSKDTSSKDTSSKDTSRPFVNHICLLVLIFDQIYLLPRIFVCWDKNDFILICRLQEWFNIDL